MHYIPFKNDLSDLTEKIKWAMDHDEEAQLISKRGREFAINNLLPKDIICYYANALNVRFYLFFYYVIDGWLCARK